MTAAHLYPTKDWAAISEGAQLPEVRLPITVKRVVMNAAATRDFFPGHHDRDYARAQGVEDMYLNTMFFHGFVDRVVTDWAGPGWWIRRRTMRMLEAIPAGHEAIGRGRVVRNYIEAGHHCVEVEVTVSREDGRVACTALITLSVDEERPLSEGEEC